jgi:ribosomal protein L18
MFDPITALVVASVTATGASVVASEKSRSQQKKANKIQEKVRQTQDSRARLAQVRQARMAQAQIVQSGATQGALGSSAVQGGFSAAGSNAENNIQFINQVDTLQQAINKRMEKANTYSGIASASAGIASIAGSFAGSLEKEGEK